MNPTPLSTVYTWPAKVFHESRRARSPNEWGEWKEMTPEYKAGLELDIQAAIDAFHTNLPKGPSDEEIMQLAIQCTASLDSDKANADEFRALFALHYSAELAAKDAKIAEEKRKVAKYEPLIDKAAEAMGVIRFLAHDLNLAGPEWHENHGFSEKVTSAWMDKVARFEAEIESLKRERDEARAAHEALIVEAAKERHGHTGMCCHLRLDEKRKADAAIEEATALREQLEVAVKALQRLAPTCEECIKPAVYTQPWTDGWHVCRDHADCDVVLRNPCKHPATVALSKLKSAPSPAAVECIPPCSCPVCVHLDVYEDAEPASTEVPEAGEVETPRINACYARAGMMLANQQKELDEEGRKLERETIALKAELASVYAGIKEPATVYNNMLRGEIAMPAGLTDLSATQHREEVLMELASDLMGTLILVEMNLHQLTGLCRGELWKRVTVTIANTEATLAKLKEAAQ